MINHLRRTLLERTASLGMLAAATALGLVRAGAARASDWNKVAFRAEKPAETVKDIGAANAVPSQDITIRAPEIAENGAIVPIEITSRIPGTESIAIVTDNNPFPLTAIFDVSNGAEGFAATRIKMGRTSAVKAYVKAGDKYYVASRDVKVTIGGCGG
ncbi:MAG TPA: thiosulfate oxidation carrier protein SoxY [Usitatibacter sp.]|nr:thiosulfate oxidation carrier protein SoxY [Usitatibacter sp.]